MSSPSPWRRPRRFDDPEVDNRAHATSPGHVPAHLTHRASLLRRIRAHLDALGFMEVQTPVLVASPGTEVHIDPLEVTGLHSPRWLQTSPEFHMKRLLCDGASRIYQICPCFRREELGDQHEPEFTMLEWYQTGMTMDGMMRGTESLISEVMLQSHPWPTPWPRATVREVLARYADDNAPAAFDDPDRFSEVWATQVHHRLGEESPLFVTHWPRHAAALARLNEGDPSCANRFELYVHGVELCNGFEELTDPQQQRARFNRDLRERRKLQKDALPLDEPFLEALERGLPPCAGNALGVDRLMMIDGPYETIQDTKAFPFKAR